VFAGGIIHDMLMIRGVDSSDCAVFLPVICFHNFHIAVREIFLALFFFYFAYYTIGRRLLQQVKSVVRRELMDLVLCPDQ
jgi:uncharacterized membrane protein (DUF106 family)